MPKETTLEIDTPITNEDRTRGPCWTRNQHQPRMEFIYVGNADGKGSVTSRKRAKAHVAKQAHARVRRKQMIKYQESRGQEAMQTTTQSSHPIQGAQCVVIDASQASNELIRPPNPSTLLSGALVDPFASVVRPISTYEQFLLDHYIHVLVPDGWLYSPSFPNSETFINGMTTEWVPLALTDAGMLNGIFVSACRSLHSLHGTGPYLEKALRYKMACITSLKADISEQGTGPRASSIAKAIILAADEVSIGDLLSGKRHIEAAQQMVTLNGGVTSLGVNRFLRGLMDIFSSDRGTKIVAVKLLNSYGHFGTADQL